EHDASGAPPAGKRPAPLLGDERAPPLELLGPLEAQEQRLALRVLGVRERVDRPLVLAEMERGWRDGALAGERVPLRERRGRLAPAGDDDRPTEDPRAERVRALLLEAAGGERVSLAEERDRGVERAESGDHAAIQRQGSHALNPLDVRAGAR